MEVACSSAGSLACSRLHLFFGMRLRHSHNHLVYEAGGVCSEVPFSSGVCLGLQRVERQKGYPWEIHDGS